MNFWSIEVFSILEPHGTIAFQERHLLFVAVPLILLVVIPVFILTFIVAVRYREGNTKAKFTPNWESNRVEEFIWWVIPFLIILILGTITWQSTRALDPYKPLVSNKQPVNIEVVSLNWKWLFIYPGQGIASVNRLEFPKDTPINMQITADSPMNGIWIPQLSGQIMAMPGMVTQLHIAANNVGSYQGQSSNFSGAGFASMKFKAVAVSDTDFQGWVNQVRQSPNVLTDSSYANLRKPSRDNSVAYYRLANDTLFTTIVDNYKIPGGIFTEQIGLNQDQKTQF